MFHGGIYVSASADMLGTIASPKCVVWTDESMDIVTLFRSFRQRRWKHGELNILIIMQRTSMLCKSEEVID